MEVCTISLNEELLDEAMKLTKVERALESIRLQRVHQVRRQAVVKHKQLLYEARRELLLHQRAFQRMATGGGKGGPAGHVKRSSASSKYCTTRRSEQLQQAIYRNIDDNDSLLQFLRKDRLAAGSQDETSDCLSLSTADGDDGRGRRRKDDKTVIEELRTNNVELRRLVDVLVGDLEESRAEVARLTKLVQDMRLRELDDDKAAANAEDELPTLSPFVFSSTSSSSSVDIAETTSPNSGTTQTDLPPLAPLEMPPLIDFSQPEQQTDSVACN